MNEVHFNVNYWVKVKLKENGIAELERQHEELQKMFPKVGKFKSPKMDEHGYSMFQMHDLMNRFGHMMQLGLDCPFETTIIICAE